MVRGTNSRAAQGEILRGLLGNYTDQKEAARAILVGSLDEFFSNGAKVWLRGFRFSFLTQSKSFLGCGVCVPASSSCCAANFARRSTSCCRCCRRSSRPRPTSPSMTHIKSGEIRVLATFLPPRNSPIVSSTCRTPVWTQTWQRRHGLNSQAAGAGHLCH